MPPGPGSEPVGAMPAQPLGVRNSQALGSESRRLGGTPCRWRVRSDSAAPLVVQQVALGIGAGTGLPVLARRNASPLLRLGSGRFGGQLGDNWLRLPGPEPREGRHPDRLGAPRTFGSRAARSPSVVNPRGTCPSGHPGWKGRGSSDPTAGQRRFWLPREPTESHQGTFGLRAWDPEVDAERPRATGHAYLPDIPLPDFGRGRGPGAGLRNGAPGFRAGACRPLQRGLPPGLWP